MLLELCGWLGVVKEGESKGERIWNVIKDMKELLKKNNKKNKTHTHNWKIMFLPVNPDLYQTAGSVCQQPWQWFYSQSLKFSVTPLFSQSRDFHQIRPPDQPFIHSSIHLLLLSPPKSRRTAGAYPEWHLETSHHTRSRLWPGMKPEHLLAVRRQCQPQHHRAALPHQPDFFFFKSPNWGRSVSTCLTANSRWRKLHNSWKDITLNEFFFKCIWKFH